MFPSIFSIRLSQKRYFEIGIFVLILAVSAYVRFYMFGYPSEVVFDETYYGKYAAGYLTQGNVFSGHPPLGSLLITVGAKLGKVTDAAPFSTIGNHLEPPGYLYLRCIIGFAGVLLPLLAYVLARLLGLNVVASFGAAIALVYENSFVVQSRFAMPDTLLLLFGFSALNLYFFAKKFNRPTLVSLAALCAGAAVSIKWTGLAYGMLLVLFELVVLWREERFSLFVFFRKGIVRIGLAILAPILLTYVLVYAIHFSLLTKFEPNSFLNDMLKAQQDMIYANTHMSPHPAQSKWFEWPVMMKPVSYWIGRGLPPGSYQEIYYTGNFFLYLLSTIAVLFSLGLILFRIGERFLKKRPFKMLELTILVLLVGYVANFLPFSLISRPMFLYHYMAALFFALLITFSVCQLVFQRKGLIIAVSVIIVCSICNFILTSPFTYGFTYQKESGHYFLWNPK